MTAIALLLGGWLAFDGAHALATGDYVTPSSGRYAGQLGPWTHLVSAVGIDPRSTLMRIIHLALGVAWLDAAALFLLKFRLARPALLACAIASLWYLPFGTLLSLIVMGLLLSPDLRKWPGGSPAGRL
ncbi:MAG TPA: hypothetical protein VLU25_01375 [Acidobacteriota bacterium]|nr:hypothetical protein [Acidobacteriota bacterium]